MGDEDITLNASFEETASPAPPEEEPYSSAFFNGPQFLNSVPEPDRPIVQRYLEPVMKGWDGGLTEKFQKSSAELKRWAELGEYEELQKARNLYNNFRNEETGERMLAEMIRGYMTHYGPESVQRLYKLLGNGQEVTYQEPNQQQEQDWDYSQGEPDPRDVQIQNMQSELEEFRQWRSQQEERALEAELNQQLDSIVSFMHNSHPNIPQEYVLQAVGAGIFNTEQIVEAYNKLAESIGSQRQRLNPPNVMGNGQAGVPSGQVDVTKLDAKGRKAAIVSLLNAADQ